MGMGRVIRSLRKAGSPNFQSNSHLSKGAVKLRALDYVERHGYTKGIVKEILRDPGRSAPVAVMSFRHPLFYKHQRVLMIAAEGIHSGQIIYAGKKVSALNVGNILPLGG